MSQFSRRLKLSAALSFMMAASMVSQAAAENGSRPGGPGGSTGPTAPAGDVTISATVNNSTLTIGANPNAYAGTVDSITFRNVQYVFSYSHGTQFSSDSVFNNDGQCFNPTQPGSQNDGTGSTSSSQLLSISNSNNVLTTSTNMAFWLAPGQTNTNGQACGPGDSNNVALNTTILSNHILNDTIQIGTNGIPNLVSFQTNYYVPNSFNDGTFWLNGYMPSNFSAFLSYNPATKTLSPLTQTSAQSAVPIIVSTPDGQNAAGVISAQNGVIYSYSSIPINTPSTGKVNIGYWYCAFNPGAIQAGSNNNFNCQVAFGTVDEDIAALNQYSGASDVSTPVYRFRNAPHMTWTTSYTAGATLWGSSTFNGVAFRVNPQGVNNSNLTLYSCVLSNGSSDYFVSDSSTCEGRTVLGVLGYASSGPGTGLTELYRFYNSSLGVHLVTVNYTEGTSAGGFSYEGPLGYVPTS